MNDLLFQEDRDAETESQYAFKGLQGHSESALAIQSSTNRGQAAEESQLNPGPQNSKEYVEMEFKVRYDGDEQNPIQTQLSIPVNQQAGLAEETAETKKVEKELCIYSEDVFFVSPMYIVHPT